MTADPTFDESCSYENGESFAGASHEELEKAYDGTLNKVNDREVVDGTVIAM